MIAIGDLLLKKPTVDLNQRLAQQFIGIVKSKVFKLLIDSYLYVLNYFNNNNKALYSFLLNYLDTV